MLKLAITTTQANAFLNIGFKHEFIQKKLIDNREVVLPLSVKEAKSLINLGIEVDTLNKQLNERSTTFSDIKQAIEWSINILDEKDKNSDTYKRIVSFIAIAFKKDKAHKWFFRRNKGEAEQIDRVISHLNGKEIYVDNLKTVERLTKALIHVLDVVEMVQYGE